MICANANVKNLCSFLSLALDSFFLYYLYDVGGKYQIEIKTVTVNKFVFFYDFGIGIDGRLDQLEYHFVPFA